MKNAGGSKLRMLIKLMRPKHYIKNLLIFVSITFDLNLFVLPTLLKVLLGFCSFCLLSSAVYVLNDIRDVEADRQHEVKKNRPIASGAVSVPAAWCFAAVLLSASLAVHIAVCGNTGGSLFVLLGYLLVNLGYSMGLKHVPFLDIVLLVSGFVLRVIYGAAIVGSHTSAWVYLTVFALSFYLGLGKRRNELVKTGGETRRALKYYSFAFLDKFMYMCLTLAVTFYALWSADSAVVERYGTDKLVWTVPLVIIILMKYSADIESNSYGDPVEVVTHDRWLLALCAAFALIMLGLIYLPLL